MCVFIFGNLDVKAEINLWFYSYHISAGMCFNSSKQRFVSKTFLLEMCGLCFTLSARLI